MSCRRHLKRPPQASSCGQTSPLSIGDSSLGVPEVFCRGRTRGSAAAEDRTKAHAHASTSSTSSAALKTSTRMGSASYSASIKASPAPGVPKAFRRWPRCSTDSRLHNVGVSLLAFLMLGTVWRGSFCEASHSMLKSAAAGVPSWDSFSILAQRVHQMKAASAGPCSNRRAGVVIPVSTAADISRRLQYPPTKTVHLWLQRDLWLSQGLMLNSSFSCTILMSRGRKPFTIYYRGWDTPVVTVIGAGNILFAGVSIQSGVRPGAPRCPLNRKSGIYYGGDSAPCPALYIVSSWAVQYTKASVYGRIDIFRSVFCRIDSVTVTMARAANPADPYENDGLIHVGQCGVGGGKDIAPSGNIISNNVVSGGYLLIVLDGAAVGVTVRNNLLKNYVFAAIRCGYGEISSFDCHGNTISYNYIFSTPGKKLTGDSAGIYFCTRWFNPGNVLTCNYIIGGDHCYYLDYAASGIVINGGVCAYTNDGVKINTGKYNHVRSLVMLGQTGHTTYISCSYSTLVTCFKYPGSTWERTRSHFFNVRSINKAYPYMKTMCNPVQAVINGKSCNPQSRPGALPGPATGWCSGVPYLNDVELIHVNKRPNTEPYAFCDVPNVPAWQGLNRQLNKNVSWGQAKFRGTHDFGIKRGSAILKVDPGFISCPRKKVGPQRVRTDTYFRMWNMQWPGQLQAVQDADYHFQGT